MIQVASRILLLSQDVYVKRCIPSTFTKIYSSSPAANMNFGGCTLVCLLALLSAAMAAQGDRWPATVPTASTCMLSLLGLVCGLRSKRC
jgi:hypothetical protein